MTPRTSWLIWLVASQALGCACRPNPTGLDAGPVNVYDGGPLSGPCALPGSWIHDASGVSLVGGTSGQPSLQWLTIPVGFCAHYFGTVPNARQIRFAPGGELFVASPTMGTTGGGAGGLSAIVVLADDNHDGLADTPITFKSGLPATQGILFANGAFYFQDSDGTSAAGTAIKREPYVSGQRQDNGQSTMVADITFYESVIHWPKTLDVADDGTIFVGNGGDQGELCQQPMPFHGGILKLDGTPCTMSGATCGVTQVAQGFRNPIDVKCHRDGNNHCFSTELALDYSASQGGREKLVTIHAGDNWGFPCCASRNLPYTGLSPVPDCSGVQQEANSFVIGNTPFGFDFSDTHFPSPWDHRVLGALHGVAGSWLGARVVAIALDPATGLPLPSSTIDGGVNTGNMADFATGWDDGTESHGRPSDVDFSSDGRMFVANDVNGDIFWVAPITP